jgi:hypothetical protein
MQFMGVLNRYFIYWVLLALFFYASIQFYYLSHGIFTTDDFWLAFHIYQYKSLIPYLNFFPYKTVLGYYFYLLPMCLSHDPIKPLFYVKETAVLMNIVFIILISLKLRQFYCAQAVFLALLLVTFSHLFLVYSSEIRVDLLAYWVCALGVILIFENKIAWAAVCTGIGFFISQKSAWCVLAADVAFLSCCLVTSARMVYFKRMLLFNGMLLLTTFIYIAFWSYFSSVEIVLRSVFYEAYLISLLDTYHALQKQYWLAILQNNALLLMLWPLSCAALFIRREPESPYLRRVFLIVYTSVIFLCLGLYQQIFPYNFIALAPTLFLLYTDFFAWLVMIYKSKDLLRLLRPAILLLLVTYTITVGLVVFFIGLHAINYLIVFIPIALTVYLYFCRDCFNSVNVQSATSTLIYLSIAFLGIACPAMWFLEVMLSMDNRYQVSTVLRLNALVAEGGDYVAGVPLLYDKPQPIAGLKHLVAPALDYMQHPSAIRARILLPSLYLAPVTSAQIVQALQDHPVKFYVNNNRFRLLPESVLSYFADHYKQFCGSIYVYSPLIKPGEAQMRIAFDGNYQVMASGSVSIDHEWVLPDAKVYLRKGTHFSDASRNYRLVLIPNYVAKYTDILCQSDKWDLVAL